jgi:hypothetical protein
MQLAFSEPKTERSRRTVPLSPAVVAMLPKHRTAQTAERLRAGNLWSDSGLVFTTEMAIGTRQFRSDPGHWR